MWKYKTYKCGWVFEVYETDQYGYKTKLIHSNFQPTRELAELEMRVCCTPHKFLKDRWVWDNAKHDYHECVIRYKEELVENE